MFILHLKTLSNDFYFDRLLQIHLQQLPDVRWMIVNLMFFNFTCQYDLKNEFHTRPRPLRTTKDHLFSGFSARNVRYVRKLKCLLGTNHDLS